MGSIIGCPVTTLTYRYPDLCSAITKQSQRVLDIGKIQEALLEALRCNEDSFPTVIEISKRLKCSSSTLYYHFGDLCQALTKKHRNNRLGVCKEGPVRGTNISEAEASLNKPKRSSMYFSAKGIEQIRQELESLSEESTGRTFTMTELASRFECSKATLRNYFPDLCDKLMRKHEKTEYVSEVRQVLEAVLVDNASPVPSLKQLSRQLKCSEAMLRYHFPDLCRMISRRHFGLTEVELQRKVLEGVIREEQINISVDELARRLKCAASTLYNRFPEECKIVVKRLWKADNIDDMRRVLEAALTNDQVRPPTLKALSESVGCSAQNLNSYFPEMCRAITERRRQLGTKRFSSQLEEMLVQDEPISMQDAARRLNYSAPSLRGCFPELCSAISARYSAYRKNKRLELEEKICSDVREIVLELYERGEYPSKSKVQALISKPSCFWNVSVRKTWQDSLRELNVTSVQLGGMQRKNI